MTLNRVPLITILFLGAFLIQEALVNRISFFIGGFAFYLAFSIAWILKEDRNSALMVGFISGFIADLSPTLESPFGLWTFVMTCFAFLLVNYIRGVFDSSLSPLALSLFTAFGSAIALLSFIVFGAILGEEVASLTILFREIVGNALWSFVLAPIYIPITMRAYQLSLTARER